MLAEISWKLQQPEVSAALGDLRRRVLRVLVVYVISFVVCFFLARPINSALTWPLHLLGAFPDGIMTTLDLLSHLNKVINLALFGAALLTIPYAASHIYAWFLGDRVGFGTWSRSSVWAWTWVLFIAGALFAYGVVVPLKIVLSGYEQHMTAATCVILWCAASVRLVHASVGRLKS